MGGGTIVQGPSRPLALLLALGLLAAIPFAASGLPSAPLPPTVIGRLEISPIAPVGVNKDNETLVTTNGTMNVTIPGALTVETRVNLTVQVNNTDWFATISPTTISLTGSGQFPFTVNVSVPGRVATDGGAEVFVAANISIVGFPPAVSRVYMESTPVPIIQYFGVALMAITPSSPENFTAQAGNQTAFSIRLQNLGNGRDSFELTMDNLAQLQGQGIGVSLPTPVSVAKGGVVQVNGNVSLPATVTSGNFSLTVLALSTGGASKGQSVTASASKFFHAQPPADNGGGQGGPDGGAPPGKGFLPGPEPGLVLVALGAGAALVSRRLRRP